MSAADSSFAPSAPGAIDPRTQPHDGRPSARRPLAGWLAIGGGLALYLLAPVAGAVSQTRLYPSTVEIHPSTVKRGSIIRTQARFWNLSLTPLTIQSVSSSCGCTAAAASKRRIGPLGSAVIRIQLDTFGVDRSYAKDVHVEVTPMGHAPATVTLRGKLVE